MAETNILGLDKFQLTIIKSNYNSTKPVRKLIDKVVVKAAVLQQKETEEHNAIVAKYKDKLQAFNQEKEAYEKQIELLDKFTLEVTEKTCGFALTTEQVMDFIDNPEKFEAYKQSLGVGKDLFENEESADASPEDYHENIGEGHDIEQEQEVA